MAQFTIKLDCVSCGQATNIVIFDASAVAQSERGERIKNAGWIETPKGAYCNHPTCRADAAAAKAS